MDDYWQLFSGHWKLCDNSKLDCELDKSKSCSHFMRQP